MELGRIETSVNIHCSFGLNPEIGITEIIVVVSYSMLFLLFLLHLYTDVDLYYIIDVVTGCHD